MQWRLPVKYFAHSKWWPRNISNTRYSIPKFATALSSLYRLVTPIVCVKPGQHSRGWFKKWFDNRIDWNWIHFETQIKLRNVLLVHGYFEPIQEITIVCRLMCSLMSNPHAIKHENYLIYEYCSPGWQLSWVISSETLCDGKWTNRHLSVPPTAVRWTVYPIEYA